MKKTIFLIFFSFFVAVTFAQRVKGKVLDITSKLPLEGVHVYVKSKEGTFTNIEGKFNLKLKNRIHKTDSIYFSHLGFTLKKQSLIQFKNNKNVVYLDMNQVDLNEVTITSEVKLKPNVKYTRLTSMKNGLYEFDSFIKDGKIYVFGGNLRVENDAALRALHDREYDLINPMNGDLRRFFTNLNLAAMNNNGGFSSKVHVFDLEKNTWKEQDYKIRKRACHNVAVNKNKAYILGGKNKSTNGLFEYLDNKIEILDLKNNKIAVDNTNPHQATNFTSFVYKDNLIVLGGSIKQGKEGKKIFSNKIHSLDLKTGLWYELGNMPIAKETSGVLVNDKIYLVGGNNNKPLKSIESYNLKTGKWKKIGELFKETSKPALASNESTIFIYDKGKIYTLDTKTSKIKEFSIAIDYVSPKMFYANNKLYLLGGFKEFEYGKDPVSSLIAIDVDEFKITKVRKEVKLSSI